MKAKAIEGRTIDEVKQALQDATQDGYTPTLAIIFISIKFDLQAVQKLFNDRNILVFGTTTEGEIIGPRIRSQSASIMLFDLNPDCFKIYFEEFGEEGYKEASISIAKTAKKDLENRAFLLSGSGVMTNAYIEKILDGFKEVMGNKVQLFGGMAGSDMTFEDTLVFSNDQISTSAIVVIAFDQNKVSVKGVSTCGWKGAGTSKSITRSEDNHVYEIDGEAPLKLIMRYAGIEKKPDNMFDLATELNQTLQTQLVYEQREPIMRVGLPNMENDNISFMGAMPEGAKIRFCLLPDLETMDESVQAIEDFRDKEAPEADAVLTFSCAGRLIAFGPETEREVKGMSKIWNAPLAGFYSQGEFSTTNEGELEVQNLINVCVVLKEI